MRLREIRIEASDLAPVPKEPVFRWVVHHVREIFTALLPKDFELDGSSLVQVTCGPKGSDLQYEQVLGSSNYFDEGFDFKKFYASSRPEQDLIALSAVERALLTIAKNHSKDEKTRNAILEASHSIKQKNFAIEIKSASLSRAIPSRKARIEVIRCLNRDDGEAWCLDVVAKDRGVLHRTWMTKRPDYLNRTGFFKKSEWVGDQLTFRDRLGKITFQFSCKEFIA